MDAQSEDRPQVVAGRFTRKELDRLDKWIASQPMPPSKSQIVTHSVMMFLDMQEKKAEKKR